MPTSKMLLHSFRVSHGVRLLTAVGNSPTVESRSAGRKCHAKCAQVAFSYSTMHQLFPAQNESRCKLRPSRQRWKCENPDSVSRGERHLRPSDYYFHKFGRSDLHYVDLSNLTPRTSPLSAYLVVENGSKYIENIAFIRAVEFGERPVWVVSIGPMSAARVYRDTHLPSLQVNVATNQELSPHTVASHRRWKGTSLSIGSVMPIGRQPAVAQRGIAMPSLTAINIQLEE